VIVAITGGTGFIGRRLIARHVAQGDHVRYLTRQAADKRVFGASAHVGSLESSADELRRFVRGADVLYHCAAELRTEAEMHNTNVLGTAHLLSLATGEVGRWVQLSSTSVYGAVRQGAIHEDTAIAPTSAYGKSKAAADSLLFETAARNDLPCVVLRPSNVYGPEMPNQALFHLIRMVDKGMLFFIGKKGAVANYIHVENVVDALTLCGTAQLPANGRTYIVSDHRTVEEFVGIIAATLRRDCPHVRLPESLLRAASALAGLVPGFPLSPSRVAALTGRATYRSDRIEFELEYKCKVSMEEGIGALTRHWKYGTT